MCGGGGGGGGGGTIHDATLSPPNMSRICSLASEEITQNDREIDHQNRAQELCDSGGGRPGLPSLISLTVSVDVKQHFNFNHQNDFRIQMDSEGAIYCFHSLRGEQSSGAVWKWRWPSWAPVPNKPYGLCGRKTMRERKVTRHCPQVSKHGA